MNPSQDSIGRGVRPIITSCSFGAMVIDGKTFHSDLIILPDGVIRDAWRRKQGHLLEPADLHDVIKVLPDKLIIGTGVNGMMKVPETTVAVLKDRGIALEIEPTPKAVGCYNRLAASRETIAACFHLTC